MRIGNVLNSIKYFDIHFTIIYCNKRTYSVGITAGLGVRPLVHVFKPAILSSMLTLGPLIPEFF